MKYEVPISVKYEVPNIPIWRVIYIYVKSKHHYMYIEFEVPNTPISGGFDINMVSSNMQEQRWILNVKYSQLWHKTACTYAYFKGSHLCKIGSF